MRKYGWIVAAVAGIDQVIKGWVRTMPIGYTFFEIPGLFSLIRCVNTGAAFSMFSGKTMLLTVVSIALLVSLGVYIFRKMNLTAAARLAFACLIGGGIGNLLDRVFLGGVTDYIRLLVIDFPIFNLADMAITGSILMLMILLFTNTFEEASEGNYGSDD